MLFDLPPEELETYLPAREEPSDFDAFWEQTLAEAREFPLDATFEPVDYGLKTIETFDVTFNGYGGQPIKGWFLLPVQRQEPLPCVVEYIGYGGGRGFPSSGNRAFDEYREETLKRLEDEQREFREFLERLRLAKDRAEFDQFMTDRKNKPSPDGQSPAPQS